MSPREEWARRLQRLLAEECVKTYEQFNQDRIWIDRNSREHRIAIMDPVYRYIAARHLRDNARRLNTRYTLGEAMAGESTAEAIDQRDQDSRAWVESTPLHKALVDGLPPEVKTLSNHWSGCPVRTEAAPLSQCRCHRRGCPAIAGDACTCGRQT